MRLLGAFCLIALAGSATASAAERPYLGAWDCEVATFWFTPNGYDNGTEILPVKKVREDRGVYRLTFTGGYTIALSSVTKTSMSWYSEATGDGFTCKRVR